jgi:hypothetical protein
MILGLGIAALDFVGGEPWLWVDFLPVGSTGVSGRVVSGCRSVWCRRGAAEVALMVADTRKSGSEVS